MPTTKGQYNINAVNAINDITFPVDSNNFNKKKLKHIHVSNGSNVPNVPRNNKQIFCDHPRCRRARNAALALGCKFCERGAAAIFVKDGDKKTLYCGKTRAGINGGLYTVPVCKVDGKLCYQELLRQAIEDKFGMSFDDAGAKFDLIFKDPETGDTRIEIIDGTVVFVGIIDVNKKSHMDITESMINSINEHCNHPGKKYMCDFKLIDIDCTDANIEHYARTVNSFTLRILEHGLFNKYNKLLQ
jgi:hypothetical protein